MAQFIKSIRVKNFRSIVDQTFSLSEESLSIFVGSNDVGKSNVLKALNLFFNDNTDQGVKFRFDDDFSYFAEKGKGNTKEVLVELEIQPPRRLKNSKPVRWTKTWRRDVKDELKFKFYNNDEIEPKSGISQWLRKLKYRYVPAEKSMAYFPQLMSELHDVLNDVHASQFRNSSIQFVSGIQQVSEDLAQEIQNLIGLPSRIQAPSDFRTLFSSLDFGEDWGGNTYPLKRRGDGIRAWHIPIILKVMAKKEQEASASGRVNPDTIWGFEEPENNLELTNAYKLAQQIYKFSADIQIFLTTHSPAFYALGHKNFLKTKIYYLTKDENRITCLDNPEVSEIDREMGVLKLVTPYLIEEINKQKDLKKTLEELEKKVISSPVVILTEDKNTRLLETLFRSSGLTQYEIWTYDGSGNSNAAFSVVQIINRKSPDTHFIIHRDRDYLFDNEVSEIQEKAKRINCTLFLTEGTDVESHFLNTKYISCIGNISEVEAEKYINEATKNTRCKSLDKFSASVLNSKRTTESWAHSRFPEEYDSYPERYRHGKIVLNELKRIFQNTTGRNLPIGIEHECLSVPYIKQIL